MRSLEELGLLPREAVEDATGEREVIERTKRGDVGERFDGSGDLDEGLPWFQTLVEGSRLGNMKKSLGSRRSRDGRVRVEWEIVEWTEGDAEGGEVLQPTGKRKLDALVGEDEKMEGSN